MRLHRVEVQAFGPFAGREVVDVDALAEQGLFLLHGPTGAGKTSVLDAVCFALYGRVPGSRATGAQLRSDHAEPDLAPEVRVEVTIGGRRFEVTRSPAWDRPKKRGTGVTTEPARTLLRELVAGEWVPRSSRNDEASQLLMDCLGMALDQFTKVVLLPQGDFAAFLRASAEERRPLLQRLFGTDRFSAVEGWLVDHRRSLAREVEISEVALGRLLARVEQAAADLPADDRACEGSADDPLERVLRLATTSRELAQRRRTEHAAATTKRDAVRRRSAERAAERARSELLAAALAEKASLQEANRAADEATARLDRARAAAAVAGDLRAADQAADELAAATRVLAEVTSEAARLGAPAPSSPAELETAAREAREEIGRLDGLAELEDDLVAREARRRALQGEGKRLGAEAAAVEDALAAAGQQFDEHTDAATRLQEKASSVVASARAVGDAHTVLAAARESAALSAVQRRQTAEVAEATEAALTAREHWLDLRERRLAGMAAELARGLVDGEPCVVCGSPEHPAPAAPAAGTVTADQERLAHEEANRAAELRAVAELELAETGRRLAVQVERCGGIDVPAAERALEAARCKQLEAQEAVTALDEHRAAAEAAAEEREALTTRWDGATSGAAAAMSQLAELDRTIAEQRERLDRARGQDLSVRARRERLGAVVGALEAVLAARRRVDSAAESARTAGHRAEAACAEAGFDTVDTARSAALDHARREQLAEAVRQHAEAWAALRGRLAQPDLLLAVEEARRREEAGRTAQDLNLEVVGAEAALAEAESAVQACAGALAVAERASTSLALLAEQVALEVSASGPLRERFAVADDLTRCVEGNGGGNAYRMRLSSFVLAARLEQVAAAASVRLADMSAGRFSLVHSDATEKGGRRSGLGLQVHDGWTGHRRETSSLSGGESFMASLALALGLADVVQAEAGGTAIETLFVDEGFGSLDGETLEEVMTVLDGLRDGGRSVGLISHVAELRQRIPAQLEVVKTRTGSHLRAAEAAA